MQRKEVDASGKTIKDWYDPDFRASYELWLRHSFLPMQPEDPKYAPVSFKGLVMPRLREFRADAHEGPAAASPMFGGGVAGGKNNPLQPQPNKANEAHDDGGDAKYYKEPEKELTKLNRALSKLEGSQIKNIAAPPSKFKVPKAFDPFDPTAEPPPDENNAAGGNEEKQDANADKSGGTLPDYCLMRLVDVNIDANKMYRYRLRIRMANPNYNRNDVASAEYKTAKELKSDWYEVPETVKVDSENHYYVVDQPKISEKSEKPPLNSARYRMWDARNEKRDQVAFQFLRWVEATPLDPRDADAVPVGDWAVADRVFVARGEFVGRKVKVDIPVWQYTKNAFVLPTGEKNVKEKNRGLVPTGIEVDFGQENPDNETILVDFEGGRSYHPTNKNLSDNSRTEVLMLSPDGKLLARNSAADAKDDFREKQRKKVIERIEDIRTGKSKE